MRCKCSNSSACSSVVPTGAVTRCSVVIRSATCIASSRQNRRSRLVRIPTSCPCESVIGTPEMRYRAMTSLASPTVAVGGRVMGSTIMPDCERLTLSTSSA